MDNVKEAFHKVKEDVLFLDNEINSLRASIDLLKEELIHLCDIVSNISKVSSLNNSFIKHQQIQNNQVVEYLKALSQNISELNKSIFTLNSSILNSNTYSNKPTDNLDIPTDNSNTPTHIPTDNLPFRPLKDQNTVFSTGNGGVPTDKPTDRQTDKPTDRSSYNTPFLIPSKENKSSRKFSEVLESLDSLKKDIRLKFKRLTDQEFLIFSTLYQLEEELEFVDYKVISAKLNLSESSIRDYIGKLIKKGIPVEKQKMNNKQVTLSISPDLKKIASLPTILQLRGL